MAASQSRSSFCGGHRFAPYGVTQQALCKIAYAGPGLSAACTPQPLRVLRAGGRRPRAGAGTWSVSQLLRKSFSQRLRRVSCVCPAHPRGLALLRGHWPCAVCPSAPKGLPQNRAKTRRLTAAASWVCCWVWISLSFCYLISSCLRLYHKRYRHKSYVAKRDRRTTYQCQKNHCGRVQF
jgi:hypothetical protein